MLKHPGATALEWAAFQGLGIENDLLPVASDPAAPIYPGSSLKSVGKVPSTYTSKGEVVGFSGWQDHQSTAQDIAKWQKNARLGISVKTRRVRAFDIDVDDPAVADQIEAHIVQACGALPCRFRSNSGKRLMMFEMLGQYHKRVIRTPTGLIEFLGDGQQFVAAGTHPSGVRYEWRNGLPEQIPSITPEQFEALWRDLERTFSVTPQEKAQSKAGLTPSARVLQATSDDTVLMIGSGMGFTSVAQTLSSLDEVLPYLTEEDADDYTTWIDTGLALKSLEPVCSPDERECLKALWHNFSKKSARYSQIESEAKWRSFWPRNMEISYVFRLASGRGWQSSDIHPLSASDLTDAANLNILAKLSNGNLRYIAELKTWMFWTGEQWQLDPQGQHIQAVALKVANFYRLRLTYMLKNIEEGPKQKYLVKTLEGWFRHCHSRRGLDDMIRLATSDARFLISASMLDRPKHLLGVANGVVDLKTGELRQNAREDYITNYCETAFNSVAQCPRWKSFVTEITGFQLPNQPQITARPDLESYLHRLVGYMLTGHTHEQKMFVAHGEGANGKNVLFDTLLELAKGYVRIVQPELLMANPNNSDPERASPLMASLQGARLAISSESKVGQKLDVALIKRHTGGGFITARRLRENAMTFEMTHKLLLMTNHRPSLDHLDEAFKGRLHIIPFDVRWNRPGSLERNLNLPDGDKELMTKLRGEFEGILAWCVAGAVKYFQEGLEPPREVLNATKQYLREEDIFGNWLAICTRTPDPRDGELAARLLESFHQWQLQSGGKTVMTMRAFAENLTRQGIAKVMVSKGTRYALQAPSEFDTLDEL